MRKRAPLLLLRRAVPVVQLRQQLTNGVVFQNGLSTSPKDRHLDQDQQNWRDTYMYVAWKLSFQVVEKSAVLIERKSFEAVNR